MKYLLSLLVLISFSAFADLRVVPGTIRGFDPYPDQLNRIHQSFPVIEAVINSEEFRTEVIHNGGRRYTANLGLTNAQIYERIMTGKEITNGDLTQDEINFSLKRHHWYWPYRTRVVAQIDNSAINSILLSDYFYAFYQVPDIAGNLTHEWIHLMGFSHSNASDSQSVPYAVGNIMAKLAKKYVEQGFLD